MTKKVLHCFEQGPDNSVCLLELDHSGEHEWTPAADVSIEFVDGKVEVVPIPPLDTP